MVAKRSLGSLPACEGSEEAENGGPDGGWGWVVAVAASVTWFFVGIIVYNFGMLFSGFLLQMGTTTTFTTLIYSLGLVISCLISAVMEPLVAAFGWRTVAVALGAVYSVALVVSAFATSALFLFFSSFAAGLTTDGLLNLSYSIVPHFFTRRRDLAISIVVLGFSLNMLVVPSLLSYLHAEYGFRSTILISGGAALNLIPAGMVFRPLEGHANNTKNGANTHKEAHGTSSKPKLLRTMLDTLKKTVLIIKSPRAVIIALSDAIYFTGSSFFSSYVPFAMQTTGYTLEQTAHCLTLVGVFHLGARLVYPLITAACRGNHFPVMAASFGLIPLSILAFTCFDVLEVKAAALALYGVATSFLSSALGPVIVDMFGLPLLLPILCMISFFEAIGFASIGPITGAVRDLTGSYTLSLYVPAAFIFLLSFLPCMCMRAATHYEKRRHEYLLLHTQSQSQERKQEKSAWRFKETSHLLSHSSLSSTQQIP